MASRKRRIDDDCRDAPDQSEIIERMKRGTPCVGRVPHCVLPAPGQRLSHCRVCHRTFGGVEAFEAHRYSVPETGDCTDPATDRLNRFVESKPGVWSRRRDRVPPHWNTT